MDLGFDYELENELSQLGFSKNEANIYLILLKKGPLNPTRLSKATGLSRPYLYDVLERMIERGLINTITINNKRHFQANDPKILKETTKLKLKKIEEIMPRLDALFNEQTDEVDVELHKGIRVYGIIIKDVIANAVPDSTVYIIGLNEELVDQIEPIYIKQYFRIKKENNIEERIIIPKGTKKVDEEKITYKEISPDKIGKTFIILYNNKSYIFITQKPFYAVVIKSKDYYESMKKIFNTLWDS